MTFTNKTFCYKKSVAWNETTEGCTACQVRSGQVRSGQVRSVCLTAHSEQAVVAHACHGHRYGPSLVPLSGTGKKRGSKGRGGGGGTTCTGRYKGVQAI